MALTLATALLSACSTEAEAPSESLPTTSAPATTTEALPVVGPPDFPVPPEARTQDAAGAEAFLRYWIDLLNRQRAIPAGQPLRDLGPDCDECRRIADNNDATAAARETYVGGNVTLNDVPPAVLTGDRAEVIFGARIDAVSIVDANGVVVDPGIPEQPNIGSGIRLIWSESLRSWLVTEFNLG
ncbi:hypothetical protein [Geodermatophilus sp. FMUSA9-8]|uniref:hypothetical protein n=1 Tax=Geodermatophilus sp. FMUSA9-8 TaxID=3120155 RepID=UPI003009A314